jgi:hypothetical protein
MTTLIARAVEKTRQSVLEELRQDPDNPHVTFLRKQGRKQGEAEGAVEAARRAPLQALEYRFGQPSPYLVKRIASITSLEKLERLLRKASLAPRLESFLESLE